jgi:glycosyltransferase involved in cell wall biosynthesis
MFNESRALPTTLAQVTRHFPEADTEIILVDDGSTDDSAGFAEHLAQGDDRIVIIRLPKNLGKGAALRAGVARTTSDAVLFMDADLSTSLKHVDDFLDRLSKFDIVIGSRSVPGSIVTQSSPVRKLMGRTFNQLMRMATDLDIHDSQCGFKAFRGDVARLLFSLSENNRFAFDPEILRLGVALGYSINEVPVTWVASDHSAVRPIRDSIRAAIDLVQIRYHTRPTRVRGLASRSGLPIPTPITSSADH